MKCFKLTFDNTIEGSITCMPMDGGYVVLTGGGTYPYIRVERDLALAAAASRIERASVVQLNRDSLVLGREVVGDEERAFIIAPTARAFEYKGLLPHNCPVTPRNPLTSTVIVLAPGQSFVATAIANTIRDAENTVSHTISFDGERLSIVPLAQGAHT